MRSQLRSGAMVITDIAIPMLIFILGLCIGSFLNVCIYRLPAGKSIVFPHSHCPACKAAIRIYDNIPVIGWLLLRGQCRDCGVRISWRYPLVELLTGCLSLCAYLKFGPAIETAIYFVFITVLIVITFIDIDHRIIPDRITLPGLPLAFVAALVLPGMTWQASLIGILAGGGSLLMVAVGYTFITGKEGMGGGDIKLLAMIGALCGWVGVLFTIFFGSVLGSVTGIATMRGSGQGTKLAIPFGPFLSVGAIGYIFFGSEIVHWYLFTIGR
jgi:leader peptidase (prepilin peptidase)/N-methyltransferase